MKGFAQRLVLKQRHNVTQKWRINDTREAQTEQGLFILRTVTLASWVSITYVSS